MNFDKNLINKIKKTNIYNLQKINNKLNINDIILRKIISNNRKYK